jgi:hypothetical protein
MPKEHFEKDFPPPEKLPDSAVFQKKLATLPIET